METPLHRCWSEVTVAHGGTVTGRVFSKTISVLIFKKVIAFLVCAFVYMCTCTQIPEENRSLEAGVAGSCGLADAGRALTPELYRQPMPAVVHRDSIA